MAKMEKSVLGLVLSWLIGIMLIIGGLMAVIGADSIVQTFERLGMENYSFVIGILKIAISLLFLIPATMGIGAFLLSAFFGGAIVAHLSVGEFGFAVFPFVLLLIVWVAAKLREPKMFS
jgi:uncharacterized membrane protein YphA (DoxX/SURF4 family)